MRPLFPKDYRNDVTLNNMVMSVDPACAPEIVAMLGSAIAVAISDIPFDGPTAATQVGMIDGKLIFNPTNEEKHASDLALTVASTRDKVIMIEAGANEVTEAKMIEAIFAAHEVNQQIIAFIDTIVAECGKAKHEYQHIDTPADMWEDMTTFIPGAEMEEAVFTDVKQVREENIRGIRLLHEKGMTLLKLHQLQIIRGTQMAAEYAACPFPLYTPEQYIETIIRYMKALPHSIVYDRFVSQSPPGKVIAPLWGLKNHEFANLLAKELKIDNG